MFKRTLLCTAAVLLAASVGMAAPKQDAGKKAMSWSGYVTDDSCAMKGMSAVTNAACVKKCVDAGGKYVLYRPSNKKVYQLDPQTSVADHATHHVRISGSLDGDTIHVESVKMIMAKKAAPAAKPAS